MFGQRDDVILRWWFTRLFLTHIKTSPSFLSLFQDLMAKVRAMLATSKTFQPPTS